MAAVEKIVTRKRRLEPKPREKITFKYRRQFAVIVTCKDEHQQEQVYAKLAARGFPCKVVCV